MMRKGTGFWIALAAAATLPAVGWAQDDGGFMLGEVEEEPPAPVFTSEVEIGLGYVTDDSFKLGEYSGLEDEAPFVIGDVTIRKRDPYDGETANYYEAIGTDLGLESRRIYLEHGWQGRYEVFFEYDQVSHFITDEAATPFDGVGSGSLTLPGGWVGATSTAGMTELDANLSQVDIETERMRFKGGATWHFDKAWSVNVGVKHETKDGIDTIAGIFGTNGGNPSSTILPEPIDYVTDTANAALHYAGKRGQLQLSYELSVFRNEEDSLLFQNPYSAAGRGSAWDPSTGFPTGSGEIALPPDNLAHYVSLTGGYNLLDHTRVTGNVSYSRYEQDESFLEFSAIPTLQGIVTTPLPRDSLEGEINTLTIDLGASSRPLPKLDVVTNFRYRDENNDTPQDVFVRIANDSQTQPAGIDNSNARINLPYSEEQYKFDLDAGYRVLSFVKVGGGYTFDRVERDFQEVDTTEDHIFRGRVSASPTGYASAWVEYAHEARTGSDYIDNAAFLQSHTDDFITSSGETFENHPEVRKYHLATRDRDGVKGAITLIPHDRVTVGLNGSYSVDDYKSSEIGLQDARTASGTIDVSYSPTDKLVGFGFVTYEQYEYEQAGHSHNPFGSPSLSDPSQRWAVDTEDRVVTTGVGFEFNVIKDKLDLNGDYTFSYARTEITNASGAAVAGAPLPDITSKWHSTGVGLKYSFRDNLFATIGYRFEALSTEDFALDGIDPDTIPFVLSMGESSPDYTAHIVTGSIGIRF